MLACLSRLHHGHHSQIRQFSNLHPPRHIHTSQLCVGRSLGAAVDAHKSPLARPEKGKRSAVGSEQRSSHHASGPLPRHPSAHGLCGCCPAFLRPGVPFAAAKTHVPNRLCICVRTPVLLFPEGCMTIVDRVFISHQPHGNQARLSALLQTARTKIWGKPRVAFDYWGTCCYTIPRRSYNPPLSHA